MLKHQSATTAEITHKTKIMEEERANMKELLDIEEVSRPIITII
jgi:hypothetical protein